MVYKEEILIRRIVEFLSITDKGLKGLSIVILIIKKSSYTTNNLLLLEQLDALISP